MLCCTAATGEYHSDGDVNVACADALMAMQPRSCLLTLAQFAPCRNLTVGSAASQAMLQLALCSDHADWAHECTQEARCRHGRAL